MTTITFQCWETGKQGPAAASSLVARCLSMFTQSCVPVVATIKLHVEEVGQHETAPAFPFTLPLYHSWSHFEDDERCTCRLREAVGAAARTAAKLRLSAILQGAFSAELALARKCSPSLLDRYALFVMCAKLCSCGPA